MLNCLRSSPPELQWAFASVRMIGAMFVCVWKVARCVNVSVRKLVNWVRVELGGMYRIRRDTGGRDSVRCSKTVSKRSALCVSALTYSDRVGFQSAVCMMARPPE